MRFKGLTIVLATVMIAISSYHLGMTWLVYRTEKEATTYATDEKGRVDYAKKKKYLQEKENKVLFSVGKYKWDYKRAKKLSLREGKDIGGGYTFVLALEEIAQLKKMVRNPNEKAFLKAANEAKKRALKQPKRSLTDHFCDIYTALKKESLAELFSAKYLPENLKVNATDAQIRAFLKEYMKGVLKESQKALGKRLSGVGGLSEVEIYQNKQGQIVVELPGSDQDDRIVEMVSKKGELAIAIVNEEMKIIEEFFKGFDALLKEGLGSKKGKKLEMKDLITITNQGTIVCKEEKVTLLEELLEQEEVINLLYEGMSIKLSSKSEEGYRQIYFLKKGISDIRIKSARDIYNKKYIVEVTLDYASGKAFEQLTGDNVGKVLAMVIDGRVQVAAQVHQKIAGGKCQISGNYKAQEAKDLAHVLGSEMNAQLVCVEKSVIGAEFAQEEKNQSLFVLLLALLLILLFMLFYYAVGGFVANVALLLNMLFILGILASFGAVLSLPGIGGIVLTIGMSIDGTVIIFASIQAERAQGVYIVDAIRRGYSKAFRVIVDSNLTTLLTGFILFYFGMGAIKSFATTLIIGIFSSFFASVFLTRLIIEMMIRVVNPKYLRFSLFPKGARLSRFNFDFLGKRKYSYLFSLAIIALGGFFIYQKGLDRGVDFTGGRVYVCQFDTPVSVQKLKAELAKQFDGKSIDIKTYGANNVLRITTNYNLDNNSSEADKAVQKKLIEGIKNATGKQYKGTKKAVGKASFSIPSTTKIMSSAAEDIKSSAWLAILLALLMILLYIFLSFRSLSLAIAAIVALIHDTLMLFAALGIAKAFGISYELDLVFVTSVLTTLGCSINDTVVVYAYIVGLQPGIRGKGIKDLVNPAINNTLNRTLPTSFTTLIPVVILYFFGGKGLEAMAFSLLIGIIFGTYSSVFIAAPLASDLMESSRKLRKKLSK